MPKTYLLINEPTGLSAAEIGRRTGMCAFDTPLGTMLERPRPFDMYGALAEIDRALNPSRCRCRGIVHDFNCPAGAGIT